MEWRVIAIVLRSPSPVSALSIVKRPMTQPGGDAGSPVWLSFSNREPQEDQS